MTVGIGPGRLRATAVILAFAVAVGWPRPSDAAGTGLVFVSNEKSHTITVLDPDSYEVVAEIQTSRRPRDMQFGQDKRLLYVACGDDDVIDIIDVATLTVIGHISTGPSPEVLALNFEDTVVYVSNEEDSMLEIIDAKEGIQLHAVPTGAEPEGVAVSEDGRTIYVTSEIADMVHVVDAEAGFVTDSIIVGTRPRRFLLTPDGKELWVSAELSGEVYIIDRETHQVIDVLSFLPPGFRQVDVTPVGMDLTRDGKTAIVTLGRANHIAFVDAATREIQDYVLVGSRAWGAALSRDESTLFVTNGLSDDVTVISMDERRPVTSIAVGRVPHSVVIDD